MGVIGVTRNSRPIGSLLVLALVLVAGYLPAAAQSGSEAVVCVGSERRTLATNPIRRVYTEDMEIVYRIGADHRPARPGRARSQLGARFLSGGVVRVVRFGDDHAVIISYTGVIRQDLTVDPEDPEVPGLQRGVRHGLR